MMRYYIPSSKHKRNDDIKLANIMFDSLPDHLYKIRSSFQLNENDILCKIHT